MFNISEMKEKNELNKILGEIEDSKQTRLSVLDSELKETSKEDEKTVKELSKIFNRARRQIAEAKKARIILSKEQEKIDATKNFYAEKDAEAQSVIEDVITRLKELNKSKE